MSAIQFGRGLFNGYHFGYTPAGGISPAYPITHAVFFKTTSITLAWRNPPEANLFQLQVSLTPDFTGSDVYATSVLTVNTATFTDSSTNDARRYWRWRYSADSGTTWGTWSRPASYWLNTSGAENVSLPRNSWMLINPSPVTDRYLFDIFPLYRNMPQNMYRVRDRNRLATLLSEYITSKGFIDLNFDAERWLEATEYSEVRRFNEGVRTFYLAMFHDFKLGDPVPNIWKVQFTSDPDLTMFNAGRQDMLTGTLNFEEV